jgi:hypothetical protein
MPWSGGSFTRTNGVHTGSTLWVQDRDAGTKILATRHDTHDQDLADGINATLEKSGSNAATGNLDIGSNRITLVADGTAKTDAATVNQIQSNAPAFQATDTGTANAYVIALSPAITAYAAGQAITFKAANASTTASTLNVNTLGTKVLKKKNDQDIASGDIEASQIITAVYDGTSFQVTSQLGSEASAGGSNTQVQYNSSGSLAGDADLTFDGTNLTVANPLYLPDGAVATPSLANTGDANSGIYFPAADTVGVVAGGTEQFRFGSNEIAPQNLLVNGAMTVAQRPTVTGMGDTNGARTAVDMWLVDTDGASNEGRFTTSQDSTSPAGFGSSLKIDTTTAESAVAAGDLNVIETRNEAQDLQQLDWGTAAAKDVTLSFWFRSPKTGTHCVAMFAQDSNRSMVKEFTIASADTFEYFALTFAGDTGGTAFADDTGAGFWVAFPLVCGSNYQISADTWTANNRYATSSQQNLLDNTANNVYISGVSLVVGAVAGDFQHQSYDTTLAKCLRYYERITGDVGSQIVGVGVCRSTTNCSQIPFNFTEKRAIPTISINSTSAYDIISSSAGGVATTNLTAQQISTRSTALAATVASGLTDGRPGALDMDSAEFIEISSEL